MELENSFLLLRSEHDLRHSRRSSAFKGSLESLERIIVAAEEEYQ